MKHRTHEARGEKKMKMKLILWMLWNFIVDTIVCVFLHNVNTITCVDSIRLQLTKMVVMVNEAVCSCSWQDDWYNQNKAMSDKNKVFRFVWYKGKYADKKNKLMKITFDAVCSVTNSVLHFDEISPITGIIRWERAFVSTQEDFYRNARVIRTIKSNEIMNIGNLLAQTQASYRLHFPCMLITCSASRTISTTWDINEIDNIYKYAKIDTHKIVVINITVSGWPFQAETFHFVCNG